MDRGVSQATAHGVAQESDTTEQTHNIAFEENATDYLFLFNRQPSFTTI